MTIQAGIGLVVTSVAVLVRYVAKSGSDAAIPQMLPISFGPAIPGHEQFFEFLAFDFSHVILAVGQFSFQSCNLRPEGYVHAASGL